MMKETERRTLAVNPQDRATRLPFVVCRTLNEPGGGPIVTCPTSGVVINGRVWGRKPLLGLFSDSVILG